MISTARVPFLRATAAALRPSAPSRAFSSASTGLQNVVLVEGCRIPFQPTQTAYNDMMAYNLARLALHGLLEKTAVDAAAVDYVLMGTVIQEAKNQNIARDAGLAAGIPRDVPSHTVTQACISSNQAICSGINLIQTGQADVVIAGGVETKGPVHDLCRFFSVLRVDTDGDLDFGSADELDIDAPSPSR